MTFKEYMKAEVLKKLENDDTLCIEFNELVGCKKCPYDGTECIVGPPRPCWRFLREKLDEEIDTEE